MTAIEQATTANNLHIRLLHLCRAPLPTQDGSIAPTMRDDVLCCTSSTSPLLEAPCYVALSYTWGDPEDTTAISINATSHQVTKHLEEALRQYRDAWDNSVALWVDAICINQEDEKEKSEQVRHMRDIYSGAQYVISWLGPASPDGSTTIAMRWLQHFGSRALDSGIGRSPAMYLRVLLSQLQDPCHRFESRLESFLKDLIKSFDSEQNPDYEVLLAGLCNILQREYWARVWVVQEVAVAAHAVFACGDDYVDVRALDRGMRLLRNFRNWQRIQRLDGEHSPRPARALINTNPARPLMLLGVQREVMARPMIRLLSQLRGGGASDPRDQIFALLGIASDAESLDLVVDYAQSTADLYLHLALTLIRHGQFSVLASCSRSSDLDLPSWVADWSRPTNGIPLQQWTTDASQTMTPQSVLRPRFSASGDRQQPEMLPKLSPQGGLTLRVLMVGEVVQVGRPGTSDGIGKWMQDLRGMLGLLSSPSDMKRRRESLWRAAVADQDHWRANDRPRVSSEIVERLEAELGHCDAGLLDSKAFQRAGFGSYQVSMQSISRGRRPLLISGDKLGIGPVDALPGDLVVIILGGSVPYVLRSVTSGGGYRLMGEAYVDECMDGQAFNAGAFSTTLVML